MKTLELLTETQAPVANEHSHNDPKIRPILTGCRDNRGNLQHVRHRASKLQKEKHKLGNLHRRQLVETYSSLQLFGLWGGQPFSLFRIERKVQLGFRVQRALAVAIIAGAHLD